MIDEKYQIEVYQNENGSFPFVDWEKKLSLQVRAIVSTRLGRLRKGNFGDCKAIKGKGTEGLYEPNSFWLWLLRISG